MMRCCFQTHSMCAFVLFIFVIAWIYFLLETHVIIAFINSQSFCYWLFRLFPNTTHLSKSAAGGSWGSPLLKYSLIADCGFLFLKSDFAFNFKFWITHSCLTNLFKEVRYECVMPFVGTKLAAVGDDNAMGEKRGGNIFNQICVPFDILCPIWQVTFLGASL